MDPNNGTPDRSNTDAPSVPPSPAPATPPTPPAPHEPSEPSTSVEQPSSGGPDADPKGGVKAWVWILIGVGALLVVGGGVALAFVLLQPKAQPVPVEVNTATTNTSAPVNEPTSSTEQSLDEYLDDAQLIAEALDQAYQRWTAAADLGADADFEGSTDELQAGLEIVESAENLYAALEPPPAAASLDDMLAQALGKARRAMEQGIIGNESDDDVDAITRSGEAIEELLTILEEIDDEIADLSADSSSAV